MGKFSKRIKGLLAGVFSVILMATLLPWTALSDSGPVIDRMAKGTLAIDFTYSGNSLAGGVFDIYHVASLDNSAVLSYTLTSNFVVTGVDINAVRTSSEVESAAKTLAQHTSGATKIATLTTTGSASSPISESGLDLGVYLVVQTVTPPYYATSSPFLVYIPMMNAEGTGWANYTPGNGEVFGAYTYTAYPKTSYNPPDYNNTVDVKVVKVWDDSGSEDERPDSVVAGLYRNGTLYDQHSLSNANNWQYIWSGLNADYTWTIGEISVLEGYVTMVDNSGNNWTLTNLREDVPIGSALNVTKAWEGDDPKTRPDRISVTLLRDGEKYETVELTADNDWTYSWANLSADNTWTVTEPDVPEGYTSTVKSVDGGFLITNTYDSKNLPVTPQTGLMQWPIPVLLGVGALLIIFGLITGRRKRKYGK